MARRSPFRRQRALSVALILLLAGSLLAIASTTAHPADHPPEPGETRDALGRIVPPGMAGPVEADGTLGPHAQAQSNDVRFETVELESDYGVESYKNDFAFNTRNPDDLENQTTNWDNALGHHINFTVELDDGRATLDCDDRFVAVAVIETTNGPLYGWTDGTFDTDAPDGADDVCITGLPGVRVYTLVFDLDGAPATITGTAYPALLSGFYTARLELYHHEPTEPGGRGPEAGTHEIGFALQDPRLELDPQLSRFPERMLRMISDTGGHASHTHQFAMPTSPLTRAADWNLSMDFTGISQGAAYTRLDHYATRTAPGVQLPADPGSTIGETPLDPVFDKLQDQADRDQLGVELHRTEYELGNVPASRASTMTIRASDFPQQDNLLETLEYVPLHIVTIHVGATMDTFTTGAESIVVPVMDRDYPLRGLSVEQDLPELPTTRVLLQDSDQETGGPLGANAGDLFALRSMGTGHEMITRARLARDVDSQWVEGELNHLDFDADVRTYRIVSMLYGPLDEFLGMRVLERGIDLQAESARYIEGQTGSLRLTVTHLGVGLDGGEVPDGIEARIQITGQGLPDSQTFSQNVTLEQGQSRTIEVTLTGSTPDTYTGKFTATSGELVKRTEAPIEVVSTERARDENRRWYEIPTVEPLVGVLALLGVVGILQRRRTRRTD